MARILITSGPTREPLDPVRFLTNASSGRMGAAIAEAVLARGDEPVIVSGPVSVTYPNGSEVHHVITTDEMLHTSQKLFADCVGVFGVAAPCDWKPLTVSPQKIKRNTSKTDCSEMLLRLIPTVDIVQTLSAAKRLDQWIVAFALETENGAANALEKLHRKRADWIALNSPASLAADDCRLEVFNTSGTATTLAGNKREVAAALLKLVIG